MGETIVVSNVPMGIETLIWTLSLSIALFIFNLLWNESDDDDDLSGGMMMPAFEVQNN